MVVYYFTHNMGFLRGYLILLALVSGLGGCILFGEPPLYSRYVNVINGTKSSIQLVTVIKDNVRKEYTVGPGEVHELIEYISRGEKFVYPGGLHGLKWRNDKKQTGQLDAEQMKNLCKVSENKSACLITITDELYNAAPNP